MCLIVTIIIIYWSTKVDDINKTTSNPGHGTDSEQRDELEINRSSDSTFVPSLLNYLCTRKLSDLT